MGGSDADFSGLLILLIKSIAYYLIGFLKETLSQPTEKQSII